MKLVAAPTHLSLIDWKEIEVLLHPHNFGTTRFPDPRPIRDTIEDFDLWFVTSGEGILSFADGAKVTLRRGVVVIFRPGDVYECRSLSAENRPSIHFFHFGFYRKKSRRRVPSNILNAWRLPRHGEMIEVRFFETCCEKIHSLRRELWQSEEQLEATAREQANLLFRSLVVEYEMSCRLQRHGQLRGLNLEHYRQVSELIGKINESPGRFHTVEEVARNCGYSADAFSKIVKAVTGRHLKQVIIDAKMERAKYLLLQSTSPLKVIAEELGYSQVYYFLRQFKKQAGHTPSEFRHGIS